MQAYSPYLVAVKLQHAPEHELNLCVPKFIINSPGAEYHIILVYESWL